MKLKSVMCEPDAKKSKGIVQLNIGLPAKSEMPVPTMQLNEIVGKEEPKGHLILGNCREICGWLAEKGQRIDLVYIDPPFATGSKFEGKVWLRGQDGANQGLPVVHYDDRKNKEDYLIWMGENLRAIRTVMSESASIYLHLDWHICHYVKVLMDEIFGAENFLNEIIWTYKSGGASKGSFAKKHDVIYLYAKNKGKHYFNPIKEKSYNRDYKAYRFKGVEEFEDEKGWYTFVNMKDVWHINMVGRTSSERVDYATQKPEALLQRIIEASTQPGMIIADFFGGSGTTAVVAARTERRFIHGDINRASLQTARKRLMKQKTSFNIMESAKIKKDKDKVEEKNNTLKCRIRKKNDNWQIAVEKYYSDKIKEMVNQYNEKNKSELRLSEKGLEMIEWISVDCENDKGAWKSTEEIWINKKGNIMQNGIVFNAKWNGTIQTKDKPKRVMIQDIVGGQSIILTDFEEKI